MRFADLWDKKSFFYSLLVGGVILFCVGIVLHLLTPPQSVVVKTIPVPKPETEFHTSFAQVIVEDNSHFTAPTTLMVAQAQAKTFTFNDLATVFDTTESIAPHVNRNLAETDTLSFDVFTHRFSFISTSFGGNGDVDSAPYKKVDVNAAITAAQKFITTKLGISGFEPDKDNIVLGTKDTYDPVAPGEAVPNGQIPDVVSIPFVFRLKDQLVFSETDTFAPIYMHVDSNGYVIGCDFAEKLFSLVRMQQANTTPLSTALKQLATNNPIVLSVKVKSDTNQLSLQNLTKIVVNQATIEYHFFSNIQMIVPMYRLDVTAFQANYPDPINLSMLVPAINTVSQ